MNASKLKTRALLHGINIEALLVICFALATNGSQGPSDGLSLLVAIAVCLFHLPGVVLGSLLWLPLSLFFSSDTNILLWVGSIIVGNIGSASWLFYKIAQVRGVSI